MKNVYDFIVKDRRGNDVSLSDYAGKVLLIVVRKTQMSELTKAIKELDPKAFVSISSATSVYGEGFEEMKTGFVRKKKQ